MKTLSIVPVILLAMASLASAGELTKEQCIDAHSRGQDAREQGKLSLARKLFLTCAQSSCPGAVQGDCARFADELSSQQPSIVLAARDGNGNDMPNTTVYIDGALVVTSLDGKPVDIDPGSHTLKFSNGGKDEVVTVVVGAGEKGRTVSARFASPSAAPPPQIVVQPQAPVQLVTRRPVSRTTHPKGSLAVTLAGGGLALAGTAVAVYGASRVPGNCSLSSHECSAPPGDPVFAKASSGASTMNIGIAVGAVGVATLTTGLIWYIAGSKTTTEGGITPTVGTNSGGISFSGQF